MELREEIRENLLRYARIAGIAAGVFLVAGLLLFFFTRPKYEVVLSADEIEFGASIKTSDLVERIGDFNIKEEQRKTSTMIALPDYEVVMDEINTKELGPQVLNFQFSDSEIPDAKKEIRIVDTTAPVIELRRSEITMSLEEYQKTDLLQEATVTDICSMSKDIQVTGEVSEEAKPGKDLDYTITAMDEAGNESTAVIRVRILEEKNEEDKADDDKEEAAEEKQVETSPVPAESSKQPAESPVPVQPAAPVTPVPQQVVPNPPASTPQTPRPSNKTYMFSDGYTMQTAPSACQADLSASGSSGSCIPIQDSQGIYKGMQLIFDD
ncbi:hypothetical protein [Dubosiella newyorkensis]|uniref:hypothetical protein n=2 Tax=Dubosiella TaxID=1937008 RepID=UPI002597C739|nr:hypothetical protein [Dubosiella newyorkensis]